MSRRQLRNIVVLAAAAAALSTALPATASAAARVTITSRPPANTKASTATFRWNAPPRVPGQCSLDGRPFSPCARAVTYRGLTQRVHTFKVRVPKAGTRPVAPWITATDTWRVDRGLPTGGSIEDGGFFHMLSILHVTFAVGRDVGGSGISRWWFERRVATLAGGSCRTYSAWAQKGSVKPAPTTFIDSSLAHARCHHYRLSVEDRAGNRRVYTQKGVVMSDWEPPSNVGITLPADGSFVNTIPIGIQRGTDPVSGLGSWLLYRRTAPLVGDSCDPESWTSWDQAATGSAGGAASFTWNDPDAETATCRQYRIVSYDRASQSREYESPVLESLG